MFLELIGTVFAGIACAGLIMFVNRVTGGRLPRWTAPVAAGLGMIAVTISMEYSWYNRTVASLPEGLEIAEPVEKKSFYQPWTYVVPYVNRFVAVDMATTKQHPDQPAQRIVDLYFFGRWAPLRKMSVAIDCAEGRRALLTDDTAFNNDGQIANADWIKVGDDDRVLNAVCRVS